MNIKIVDYKLGNIFNVAKAFNHIGQKAELSSDPREILKADAIVLPGVGAFGDAMESLESTGLGQTVLEFVASGKPICGICLGMQLLMTESFEMGTHQGLNLIPGSVKRFENTSIDGVVTRVPLISWQDVTAFDLAKWEKSPMRGIESNQSFYFVHSYYVEPESEEFVLGTSRYSDKNYCSMILKENIFATQFHPEKSGEHGLRILKNWVSMLA